MFIHCYFAQTKYKCYTRNITWHFVHLFNPPEYLRGTLSDSLQENAWIPSIHQTLTNTSARFVQRWQSQPTSKKTSSSSTARHSESMLSWTPHLMWSKYYMHSWHASYLWNSRWDGTVGPIVRKWNIRSTPWTGEEGFTSRLGESLVFSSRQDETRNAPRANFTPQWTSETCHFLENTQLCDGQQQTNVRAVIQTYRSGSLRHDPNYVTIRDHGDGKAYKERVWCGPLDKSHEKTHLG